MKFHCIGAYLDGQECEDDVTYKKEYLKTGNSFCPSYFPPPPCSDERANTPPEDAETMKKLVDDIPW